MAPLFGRPLFRLVAVVAAMLALELPANTAPLPPRDGVLDYESGNLLSLRDGTVNVAGGNFLHSRRDLTLDTRLGPVAVGAVYNSKGNYWLFDYDAVYIGGFFLDPTGALHSINGLPDGTTIAGTTWVKVSATAVKTKGGLLFEFSPSTGRLLSMRWTSSTYPQIQYVQGVVAGQDVTTSIRQCTSATACTTLFTIEYNVSALPIQVTDLAGRVVSYAYTGTTLTTAKDGLDNAKGWAGTRYEYSATTGRISAITNSENERWEILSDSQGRILQTKGIGGGDPTTTYSYSDLVNGAYTTTVIDPLGHSWFYVYDGTRRLLSSTTPEGDTQSSTWNGLRPATTTDAAGIQTGFTYTNDDLTMIAEPSGNYIQVYYAPNAVNRENPLARPLESVASSSAASCPAYPCTLQWGYGYDSAGRLTQKTEFVPAVGLGTAVTSFVYDSEEMISKITFPGGSRSIYLRSYGVHGKPAEVSPDNTNWALFNYDSVGNLRFSPTPTPNGQGVVLRTYDADRNVVDEQVRSFDAGLTPNSTLQSITFTYRSDGQPSSVLPPYGGNTTWSYDALGRPISSTEQVS